jgi:dipeptidyl aminopeptidase B
MAGSMLSVQRLVESAGRLLLTLDLTVLQDQTIYPLPKSLSSNGAYLDIVPTPDGYNHIALFNPGSASEGVFLTSGDWEVTGGIKTVDVQRKLMFVLPFISAVEKRY